MNWVLYAAMTATNFDIASANMSDELILLLLRKQYEAARIIPSGFEFIIIYL